MRALLIAGVGASLVLGSAAFNASEGTSRTVRVDIVGDASAYLSVAASGDHACFVDVANGKVSITFDTPSTGCASVGTGTGINAGDSASGKSTQYAFHDLLRVINKGTKPILLWVNASTATGSSSGFNVSKKLDASQMVDGDYYESSSTSLSLAVGDDAYVGVRAKSGTLTSGSATGTLRLEARRSG